MEAREVWKMKEVFEKSWIKWADEELERDRIEREADRYSEKKTEELNGTAVEHGGDDWEAQIKVEN